MRIREFFRRPRAILASEIRTLAFVAAVVFVLVLFRQVNGIDFDAPITVGEYGANVVEDFAHHILPALTMLLVLQPVRRSGPRGGVWRIVVLIVAIVLAAALTTTGRALWLIAFDEGQTPASVWPNWHLMFLRFAVLSGMLVTVGEFHRNQILSLERMRAAEADRAALEQETLQARLKTLEAQIEPHFLFNILANVRRLYEIDAVAGEAMLGRLLRYFEVALPSMRDQTPTLGREAQLIEAYLELQQVRMGPRLAYRIDIDAKLARIEVPSMMLLTLVENAIKHGLAPRREGGTVEVGAHIEGTKLRLEVADTGRGFGDDTSGGGTGLANIRARLTAMFGQSAELKLTPRMPTGLVATISMPAAVT